MVERAEVAAVDGQIDGGGPFAPGEKAPEGLEHLETPAPEGGQEEGKKFAGKFDTPEDMEKAYLELQKKLGQPSEDDSEEAEDEGTTDDGMAEAREALRSRGLDMDAFTKEMQEQGSLSQDSYDALAKAGYARAMVDAYIRGQTEGDAGDAARNASEAAVKSIKESVGGEQSYNEMIRWAQNNLSEAEIGEFNEAVGSGAAAAKYAVQGMKARFDAENGVEGRLEIGGNTPSGGAKYRSRAEQQRDMADPRYGVDPAFTHDVEQKSMRSDF